MSQSWGLLNGIASGGSSQHICCSEKLPEHVLVLLVGGGLTLSVQALDCLRAAEATQTALKLLEAEVGRLRDSHHVLRRLLVLRVLVMDLVMELGGCRGSRLDCAACCPQEARGGEGLVADQAIAGLDARLRHVEVAILSLALLVDHEAGLLEENLVG